VEAQIGIIDINRNLLDLRAENENLSNNLFDSKFFSFILPTILREDSSIRDCGEFQSELRYVANPGEKLQKVVIKDEIRNNIVSDIGDVMMLH